MPGSIQKQLDMLVSDCGYFPADRHAAVLRPIPVLSSGSAGTVIHGDTADCRLIADIYLAQVFICTED